MALVFVEEGVSKALAEMRQDTSHTDAWKIDIMATRQKWCDGRTFQTLNAKDRRTEISLRALLSIDIHKLGWEVLFSHN